MNIRISTKKTIALLIFACFITITQASMPCDTIIIDTLNQQILLDEEEIDEIKSVKVLSKISLIATFSAAILPFFPSAEGVLFLALLFIGLLLGLFSKMKIKRYDGLRHFMDKNDPLAVRIKEAMALSKAAIRFALLPLLAGLIVVFMGSDDFFERDYFITLGGLSLAVISAAILADED